MASDRVIHYSMPLGQFKSFGSFLRVVRQGSLEIRNASVPQHEKLFLSEMALKVSETADKVRYHVQDVLAKNIIGRKLSSMNVYQLLHIGQNTFIEIISG